MTPNRADQNMVTQATKTKSVNFFETVTKTKTIYVTFFCPTQKRQKHRRCTIPGNRGCHRWCCALAFSSTFRGRNQLAPVRRNGAGSCYCLQNWWSYRANMAIRRCQRGTCDSYVYYFPVISICPNVSLSVYTP